MYGIQVFMAWMNLNRGKNMQPMLVEILMNSVFLFFPLIQNRNEFSSIEKKLPVISN